jgi:hypothetical protein
MCAHMAELSGLTPLQRDIYEVDQLGLDLRESMRIVTQRVGFFVGQERYLQERQRIATYVAAHGSPEEPIAPGT